MTEDNRPQLQKNIENPFQIAGHITNTMTEELKIKDRVMISVSWQLVSAEIIGIKKGWFGGLKYACKYGSCWEAGYPTSYHVKWLPRHKIFTH